MPYMDFARPLVIEYLKNKANTALQNSVAFCKYYDEIMNAMAQFDGKKLTKTHMNKLSEIVGYTVQLSNPCSNLHYLTFDNNSEPFRIFIGYSLVYDHKKVLEDSQGIYQNTKECILKYKEALKKIPSFVKRYNTLLEKNKALVEDSKSIGMEYDFDVLCVERK